MLHPAKNYIPENLNFVVQSIMQINLFIVIKYHTYTFPLVAMDLPKTAEAIIEVGVCQLMMNNLNNALKTFERAMKMNGEIKYIPGMCETRMHLAAVMQRYSKL